MQKDTEPDPRFLAIIHSNLAVCHHASSVFSNALTCANQAIAADPTFAKAYLRAGKAAAALNDLEAAKSFYQKGLKVDPSNSLLKKGKKEVNAQQQQAATKVR
jgi:tetratricopeptide (TPR) repeat protein